MNILRKLYNFVFNVRTELYYLDLHEKVKKYIQYIDEAEKQIEKLNKKYLTRPISNSEKIDIGPSSDLVNIFCFCLKFNKVNFVLTQEYGLVQAEVDATNKNQAERLLILANMIQYSIVTFVLAVLLVLLALSFYWLGLSLQSRN